MCVYVSLAFFVLLFGFELSVWLVGFILFWFFGVFVCLFGGVPICFLKRKGKKAWIWNSGEGQRIWEEMRKGSSDQNIMYENKIYFKLKKKINMVLVKNKRKKEKPKI